jgi:predicted ArsR family transcriptional regulator
VSFRDERFVTDDVAARLGRIAALAEPARRDLYLYVVAQSEPVSRDQAAADTGLPRHGVKFHLDRLVADGLLEVEFRRLTGRQGPGAGRPAKLYRRAPGEISVTLPQREYDLAGRILADAIHEADEGTPIRSAVARAATEAGRAAGARVVATTAAPVDAAAVLTAYGYQPRTLGNEMVLVNCPFHALAVEHTELICGMNLEFVRAMTQELGFSDLDVHLAPAPGRCCVALRAG